MSADGANFGSLLANDKVAAVAALPDHFFVAGENEAAFNVGEELAIAFFMLLLDLGNAFHQIGDIIKAFFAGGLGETGVHVGPLIVFTGGSVSKVVGGGGDAIMEELEPKLGVFLFVLGGLFKQIGDLDVAILLGLGGIRLASVLEPLRFILKTPLSLNSGECSPLEK